MATGNQRGPYYLGPLIGEGGFGKVFYALNYNTGQRVACKMYIKKTLKSSNTLSLFLNEVEVLTILKESAHVNVIRMVSMEESKADYCMAIELCSKGDLFDVISSTGGVKDAVARGYFQQLLTGLSHCHKLNIIHRDIKPDNCLIDQDGNVKLADFGLACHLPTAFPSKVSNTMTLSDEPLLTDFPGTQQYASPEMVRKQPYRGSLADVWALGVLLFSLIAGRFPFTGTNTDEINSRISAGNPRYTLHFSTEVKDLLKQIFTSTSRRISLEGIHEHEWLQISRSSSRSATKRTRTPRGSPSPKKKRSLKDSSKTTSSSSSSLNVPSAGGGPRPKKKIKSSSQRNDAELLSQSTPQLSLMHMASRSGTDRSSQTARKSKRRSPSPNASPKKRSGKGSRSLYKSTSQLNFTPSTSHNRSPSEPSPFPLQMKPEAGPRGEKKETADGTGSSASLRPYDKSLPRSIAGGSNSRSGSRASLRKHRMSRSTGNIASPLDQYPSLRVIAERPPTTDLEVPSTPSGKERSRSNKNKTDAGPPIYTAFDLIALSGAFDVTRLLTPTTPEDSKKSRLALIEQTLPDFIIEHESPKVLLKQLSRITMEVGASVVILNSRYSIDMTGSDSVFKGVLELKQVARTLLLIHFVKKKGEEEAWLKHCRKIKTAYFRNVGDE